MISTGFTKNTSTGGTFPFLNNETPIIPTSVASTPPVKEETAPVKSRLWKVIDAICSPFKWIAGVFKDIGVFFKELFSEEDYNYEPSQSTLTPEQKNANELALYQTPLTGWTSQVETLEKQAKDTSKIVKAHDFSTPQKLLEWLRIHDTYSNTESPISKELHDKFNDLNGKVQGLKNPISDKPGNLSVPLSDMDKKHCKDLEAQQKAYKVLDDRLGKFMKNKGGDISKLWQTTFDSQFTNIVVVVQKHQVAVYQELQKLQQSVIDRSLLAGYRDYCELYGIIEKRLKDKDINPQFKITFARCVAQHEQIKQLGGIVSASLDQGLNNIGNTCWINSAIQALRKSPYLLARFRAEQVKYATDLKKYNDADEPTKTNLRSDLLIDRLLMLQALNAVFDAMESGQNVEGSLQKLQDQMFNSIKNNVVPSELSSNPGRQQDVAEVLMCFLNFIEYRVLRHKKIVKTTSEGDKEQVIHDLDTEGSKYSFSCLPLPIHSGFSLRELLEAESIEEAEIRKGKLEAKFRFAELPPVLVLSLVRFVKDEETVEQQKEIKKALESTFPDWNSEDVQAVSEFALQKVHGISMAQITNKITRPIPLKVGDELDLSESFITENDDLFDRRKARYELVSFIHHDGSLNHGHYTAAGVKPDGSWSDMSDTTVRTIDVMKKIAQNQALPEQDRKSIDELLTESERKELKKLNDKVSTAYAYVFQLKKGLDQGYEESDKKVAAEFAGPPLK